MKKEKSTIHLGRKCPICRGGVGEYLYHISMTMPEKFPIKGDYDVVCCSDCGFIYADINDTQESYNKYYAGCCYTNSNVSELKGVGGEFKAYVELLEKYADKKDKILDIGCRDGVLLERLRKRGFCNLYGVDPSAESVKMMRNKGIEGAVGNLFDEVSEELEGKFDVVCFTAVLEHIYDIRTGIMNIEKYLIPQKGKLFLAVPAVEGFEKYRKNLPDYFNCEHINYFSLKSLDNLLASASFVRVTSDDESFVITEAETGKAELLIVAIYEKQNKVQHIVKDIQSIESVKRYFQIIEEKNDRVFEILKRISAEQKEIIIWGAGAYSQWLFQNFAEIREAVACFIDNNVEKQGNYFCGKPIYGADFLEKKVKSENDPEEIIVICSMRNAKDIADQIDRMNKKYEYIILS